MDRTAQRLIYLRATRIRQLQATITGDTCETARNTCLSAAVSLSPEDSNAQLNGHDESEASSKAARDGGRSSSARSPPATDLPLLNGVHKLDEAERRKLADVYMRLEQMRKEV